MLLAEGVDLTKSPWDNIPPLSMAANCGYGSVLRLFLDQLSKVGKTSGSIDQKGQQTGFQFTIKFHIIHAPGPLSFSTGHNTLGTTGHGGDTRLKIVDDGSTSAGVTRQLRNSSRFAHIETDPNAEVVSWTTAQPL